LFQRYNSICFCNTTCLFEILHFSDLAIFAALNIFLGLQPDCLKDAPGSNDCMPRFQATRRFKKLFRTPRSKHIINVNKDEGVGYPKLELDLELFKFSNPKLGHRRKNFECHVEFMFLFTSLRVLLIASRLPYYWDGVQVVMLVNWMRDHKGWNTSLFRRLFSLNNMIQKYVFSTDFLGSWQTPHNKLNSYSITWSSERSTMRVHCSKFSQKNPSELNMNMWSVEIHYFCLN